jgi:hypothetical protein
MVLKDRVEGMDLNAAKGTSEYSKNTILNWKRPTIGQQLFIFACEF